MTQTLLISAPLLSFFFSFFPPGSFDSIETIYSSVLANSSLSKGLQLSVDSIRRRRTATSRLVSREISHVSDAAVEVPDLSLLLACLYILEHWSYEFPHFSARGAELKLQTWLRRKQAFCQLTSDPGKTAPPGHGDFPNREDSGLHALDIHRGDENVRVYSVLLSWLI